MLLKVTRSTLGWGLGRDWKGVPADFWLQTWPCLLLDASCVDILRFLKFIKLHTYVHAPVYMLQFQTMLKNKDRKKKMTHLTEKRRNFPITGAPLAEAPALKLPMVPCGRLGFGFLSWKWCCSWFAPTSRSYTLHCLDLMSRHLN